MSKSSKTFRGVVEELPAETRLDNDDLLSRAGNVDQAISDQAEASPLERAMSDPPPIAAPPAAAPADPGAATSALKETFCVLLQVTIARLHSELDWSDPGEEWRDQVGNNLGLLADRYIGEMAVSHTLEISLVFLILPWMVENVVSKGFTKKKTNVAGAAAAGAAVASSARGDGIRQEYVSPGVA